MTQKKFTLRKTNESDTDSLFSWRNDPTTYKYFLNPHPVEWDSHVIWLKDSLDSLKNPDRWMFTGETTVPVSSVRIDRRSTNGKDGYDFSWLVAPKWRGKGFGKQTLQELIKIKLLKGKLLRAMIHKENIASIKLSESVGFRFENQTGDWLNYYINN